MIGEAQAVKVGLSRAHSKVAAAWSDVNKNVAVVETSVSCGRPVIVVSGGAFTVHLRAAFGFRVFPLGSV